MNVRNPISPNEAKSFDTEQLRKAFLIEGLFIPGEVSMTYSHFDRIISGGAIPTDKPLELSGGKEIGAEPFLEHRELWIINIGSAGAGTQELPNQEGISLGCAAGASGRPLGIKREDDLPVHSSGRTGKLSAPHGYDPPV